MVDVTQVHSLTDFQRNAKEHIDRLKQTGKPEVLTVNGQAEVIVQSTEAYQQLLDDGHYRYQTAVSLQSDLFGK